MTHLLQPGQASQSLALCRVFLATYVDPGSGSYYYQIVIGGFTTAFYFLAVSKNRIASFFKKSPAPGPKTEASCATDRELPPKQ